MKREFRQLRLSQLDRGREVVRSFVPRPSGGWIASVREALGLSQRQVGKKMRASGQAKLALLSAKNQRGARGILRRTRRLDDSQ